MPPHRDAAHRPHKLASQAQPIKRIPSEAQLRHGRAAGTPRGTRAGPGALEVGTGLFGLVGEQKGGAGVEPPPGFFGATGRRKTQSTNGQLTWLRLPALCPAVCDCPVCGCRASTDRAGQFRVQRRDRCRSSVQQIQCRAWPVAVHVGALKFAWHVLQKRHDSQVEAVEQRPLVPGLVSGKQGQVAPVSQCREAINRDEPQRRGIHAVAQSRGGRTIIKDMA